VLKALVNHNQPTNHRILSSIYNWFYHSCEIHFYTHSQNLSCYNFT